MELGPRTPATWYQTPVLIRVIELIPTVIPPADVTRNLNASPLLNRGLLRANPSKPLERVFCLNTMYWYPVGNPPDAVESSRFTVTQASIVRFAGCRTDESGI